MFGAQGKESADVESRIAAAIEVYVSWRRFVSPPTEIRRYERDPLCSHLREKGVPALRVVAPEVDLPAKKRYTTISKC
jgi:hypothetical protein